MVSIPQALNRNAALVFRALGHDQPRDSHVHGAPHARAKPTAQLMQYERGVCARRTATKYRNTTATTRHLARLGAARTCLATDIVAAAGSSGRRGRRFKSCHPDCIPAGHQRPAPEMVRASLAASTPKRNAEGTRGNPRESPGPTSTGRRTPGLPARRSRPRGTVGSFRAL
jgi:hypothetical protein